MRIALVDEMSNICFLEIEMTPGDLMCVMTGRALRVHMRLRNLGWNGSYFTKGSLTRQHWVACCALAKILAGRKK